MKKRKMPYFLIMTMLINFVLFTPLKPSLSIQSNGSIIFCYAEDPDTDGMG